VIKKLLNELIHYFSEMGHNFVDVGEEYDNGLDLL